MNRRIRVPEVRVIFEEEQLGVLPTHEALRLAEEKGLDLVEVSPKAMPPVCRIMDYGKFKYEQAKKAAQARKHASVIEVKEIKFRPKTDDHDFDFKVAHIRRFLEEGNKVRLVIAFRGREIVHPETGRRMLENVVKACSDVAHVEQIPMMDGRRMVMIVSPRVGRPGTTAPRPAAAPAAPRPAGPSSGPVAGPAGPAGPAAAPSAPRPAGPSTAPTAAAAPQAAAAPRPGNPPKAE